MRVVLPPDAPDGSKQGVDDYLGSGGDFTALFTRPENQPREDGELFDSWEPTDLSKLGAPRASLRERPRAFFSLDEL